MSSFNYKGSLTMKMNRYEASGSINNTGLQIVINSNSLITKRAITILAVCQDQGLFNCSSRPNSGGIKEI